MSFIWMNGAIIPANQAAINPDDRGFLYGYGLFETIAIRQNHPTLLAAHLRRLNRSLPQLNLTVPYPEERLAEAVLELTQFNGIQEGVVKIIVTAGLAERNRPTTLITVKAGLPYTADHYRDGLRATFTPWRRDETSPFAGLKTLNYLPNIIAREKARAAGFDEAFFLNTQGRLAEGSACNIFLLTGNRLLTPDTASGLLPGVARAEVLALARHLGLEVVEKPLIPDLLATADEVFLTNSLMGVMPLAAIDHCPVGNCQPGPLTTRLRELYFKSAALPTHSDFPPG